MRQVLRVFLAGFGGALSAFVVAFLEARAVVTELVEGGREHPSTFAITLLIFGVIGPVSALVGFAVGVASLVLEPGQARSPLSWVAVLRSAPGAPRVRAAALAPLVVFAFLVWVIGCANAAAATMGSPTARDAGLTMGIACVSLFVLACGVVAALFPVTRRVLAASQVSAPALVDPVVTGGVALLVAIATLGVGIGLGDTGGAGGVPAIGIFGVLKRAELDLRGPGMLAIVAVFAWAGPVVFARWPSAPASAPSSPSSGQAWAPPSGEPTRAPHAVLPMLGVALGASAFVLVGGMTMRSARALNAVPEVADSIASFAPLGGPSLKVLRKLTDRDKDGYSSLFGGADCDDKNPNINPNATDEPGNGIDEDCSGADTPLPPPPEPVADVDKPASTKPERTFNIVLITVDTLRHDLGFSGYPKPVTPNLDKLAAKSSVFEQVYSTASYTAKSMGPMHIGRYPSETKRDYDHYTTYFSSNTFVAERLQAGGVRTVGGMCHYYFRWKTGYSEGFDVWDTSAIVQGMADNDSSITSDRLSDLAIKLLSDPANVTPERVEGKEGEGPRRFLAWFHYFDPHTQYVAHPEAPPMGSYGGEGEPPKGRQIYDQEVWFTDKHIGRLIDFIESQPWGADTAIMVTADHGEAFGDAHGVRTHGHEIWESLIRIPLVLYVPGATPRRVPQKRSNVDIAPTLLELTGVPRPEEPAELRGESLLADVFAAEGTPYEERDVYIDMPEGPFNDTRRAIITGPSPGMKLIHFGGRRYQLYDLAKDPGEREDLSKDPEVLAGPMAAMERFRSRLKEISVGR